MRSSPKIACSTSPEAPTVAATRSIGSPARSRRLTLTFGISPLSRQRNWAMAGVSNGYRAAPVKRQSTRGPTSSLPGTAGLPPCISFSTSYPELDDARGRTSPPSLSGTLREKDRLSLLWALDTRAVLHISHWVPLVGSDLIFCQCSPPLAACRASLGAFHFTTFRSSTAI